MVLWLTCQQTKAAKWTLSPLVAVLEQGAGGGRVTLPQDVAHPRDFSWGWGVTRGQGSVGRCLSGLAGSIWQERRWRQRTGFEGSSVSKVNSASNIVSAEKREQAVHACVCVCAHMWFGRKWRGGG